MQEKFYTDFVNQKFSTDGSVLTYPGNTIICFIDPRRHSAIYQRCLWVLDQLQAMPWQHKFTTLPPSSFHMTVMDLLCDQVRTPADWSSRLPLSATLEETDAFLLSNVPTVPVPDNLRFRYTLIREPVKIELEPDDKETETAIWHYRNQIAEVTGVRFSEHAEYKFHIGLAYQIVQLTAEEQTEQQAMLGRISQTLQGTDEIFEPDSPQLVFFDDMFRFVPESERHTLITRMKTE